MHDALQNFFVTRWFTRRLKSNIRSYLLRYNYSYLIDFPQLMDLSL